MSFNNRRGGGNFNKGSAPPFGQRRSGGPNNFSQNPPSQNFGNQQNEGFGQFNQQPATRQQPPRTPSAQQQLAKQQQMLVQKKQQLAQQQKGIQQKQQMAQQKQSQQQKQQENLELKKKKELEEQKQKELELQKQKELELQKQKELELQKQKELELQKQKELELQKQKELELQKQKELELQKQKELELQKQKELELQKQQELELQRQKEQEELAKKELEQQKQAQEEERQGENDVVETMEVEQGEEGPEGAPQPPISGGDTDNRPPRRRFPQRNRKLSKYEIQRRRNLRLSKLLQPKSAMVILNEVGKSVTYNVERSQTRPGPKGYMFKATVVVDDTTHEGYGLSKASAKNEAAEKALRFLVKNKKLIQTTATEPTNPPETEDAMDTSEKVEKPLDIPLAWQQFASFAIYKLLDSWGEDLEVIKEDVKVDKKPAKKLPPNPELINPLMLMNQMLPRVNFVELPKTSNGPFNTFNFQAVVDGQTFNGSGVSKKVAKRAVAFAICNEVLGIQYPPEIYTPPVKSEVDTSSAQPEAMTC